MSASDFSIIDFFNGLDVMTVLDMILAVIPAIICVTLHEYAHGRVALRLGDDTAKNARRLTLNPFKHIDIVGLLMMIAFKFGWAKPVPVNMYNFRNPKRDMAKTALAGPLVNVLICIVFLFLYGIMQFVYIYVSISQGLTEASDYVLQAVVNMFYITAYLSMAFAIFNILPIPPLDGSKVLFSAIGDNAYDKLMRYERYGMLLLLVLVAFGILGKPLGIATDFIMNKLGFFDDWGFYLMNSIFG